MRAACGSRAFHLRSVRARALVHLSPRDLHVVRTLASHYMLYMWLTHPRCVSDRRRTRTTTSTSEALIKKVQNDLLSCARRDR